MAIPRWKWEQQEPEPEKPTWKPVTLEDVRRRKKQEEAYRKAKRESREPEPVEPSSGYESRPGKTYSSGITARYRGMDKKEDLGFDKEPDFISSPIAKYESPFDIERQAGRQAGLTQASIFAEKHEAGYESYLHQKRVFLIEQERIRKRMSGEEGISGHLFEFGRFLYTGTTPENLLWRKQIVEGLLGEEKGKQERLLSEYTSTAVSTTKTWKTTHGIGSVIKPFEPGGLGFLAISSYGIGAGMGALSAAAPTVGKVVQYGLGGYMAYSTGKGVITSKDPYKELLGVGLTLPIVALGYRKGFRFGYGRTEAHLYKIHTYKPGTSEWIRFDQAMKLGRSLQKVSPIKKQPLDFAKDIMRMDKTTAKNVMKFLESHPKTTIGGSSASYTQIVGARQPRDIDLLVRGWADILTGGKKTVSLSKSFFGKTKTPSGQHLIDIHGREMYHWGKYHRFGFVSQRSIKIDDYRYLRGGEQLFRKGVSSVLKETEYRHGVFPGQKGFQKDIYDFVTHSKSQIRSLQQSRSPIAQWRATWAEKALDIFIHPTKAKGFGVSRLSSFSSFVKNMTKPVQPKIVSKSWGYDYLYPKSAYPSYLAILGLGGYSIPRSYQYKTPPVKTMTKGLYQLLKQPYPKEFKTSKTPKILFDYKPSETDYTPYKPTKKGYPTITQPHIPPYLEEMMHPKKIRSSIKKLKYSPDRGIRKKQLWDLDFDIPDYRFREHDIGALLGISTTKKKHGKKRKHVKKRKKK